MNLTPRNDHSKRISGIITRDDRNGEWGMTDPEDTEIKAEIDKITDNIDTIIKNITTVVPLDDPVEPPDSNGSQDNEIQST